MHHIYKTVAGVVATTPDPNVTRVSHHIRPPRRRGAHNPLLAAGEARELASGGEATARGVPRGPRATHLFAMGRSVCDPVLRPTNTRRREGPRLHKRHPPRPSLCNSGGESIMTHPGRGQCPPISRYGGPDGTPRPRASAPTPLDPKTRQVLRNLGVPGPLLPGPPSDGPPFPGAGNYMAHDARKF